MLIKIVEFIISISLIGSMGLMVFSFWSLIYVEVRDYIKDKDYRKARKFLFK